MGQIRRRGSRGRRQGKGLSELRCFRRPAPTQGRGCTNGPPNGGRPRARNSPKAASGEPPIRQTAPVHTMAGPQCAQRWRSANNSPLLPFGIARFRPPGVHASAATQRKQASSVGRRNSGRPQLPTGVPVRNTPGMRPGSWTRGIPPAPDGGGRTESHGVLHDASQEAGNVIRRTPFHPLWGQDELPCANCVEPYSSNDPQFPEL